MKKSKTPIKGKYAKLVLQTMKTKYVCLKNKLTVIVFHEKKQTRLAGHLSKTACQKRGSLPFT